MNETHQKDLIYSRGFNSLRMCRYGTMLYNHNDIYVGKSFDYYGEFSEKEIELFRQLIRPGDVVLDIGANIGPHTLYFSKAVAQKGLVLAFEPQRIIYQTLCANMALNSVLNVQCFNVAVGEIPGSIVVPILDYNAENNFGGLNLGTFESGERVQVVPLDSLNLPRCNFLKIDVEGMEIKVLKGAQKTIQRHKPLLYVENDRKENASMLVEYISTLGYKMYLHLPPLFNKDNFYKNDNNVFGNTVSINLLCFHSTVNTNISGLAPVEGPQDIPLD
jgi:FkbM family methyltransferase